jgi:hypothetical protein
MNVLLWHLHGSWTTSFVQGDHDVLVPVLPDRGPYGLGRARTWVWPPRVREVAPAQLWSEPVDVVVLQRVREIELAREWLGREPGRDLPAVFVEHDLPRGDVPGTRHPLAEQNEIPIAHVTAFNELMWDNGRAPHLVVEHGIVDPGPLWTGELPRAAVVVNDPVRRGRLTGTDLLAPLSAAVPLDVFGMNLHRLHATTGLSADRVQTYEDLPQHAMHVQLARRRLYLHPLRWTSLGLSLLEAMALGMPVVALGSTEAWEAVPPGAGVVTTRVSAMAAAAGELLADRDAAAQAGSRARAAVLERYGLRRFLDDWDRLLKEVAR